MTNYILYGLAGLGGATATYFVLICIFYYARVRELAIAAREEGRDV